MSNLFIKDLTENHQLDRKAASAILGGMNDWVRTFSQARPTSSPMSVFNISYTNNTTYIDNDYVLVQPQFFNIGNGVENSGSISYNVNPTVVSALSPTSIQA
ncbi:MAG: hypothetical protein WBO73_00795 [Gammaproteobacteria bacterium]|jgi:hypothetical protein